MAGFAKREGIQLAHPATEKRIKDFPLLELEDGTKVRQFFWQPKLNGERARVEWVADKPYFISSYGNDFRFLDHLQAELITHAAFTGHMLKHDGEVYVHGWSRERIDSALRRTKNKSADVEGLEYHIFDEQIQKAQYERLHRLGTLEQQLKELDCKSLKVVEYGVTNENDWIGICARLCEEGYEGIMLRNPFAVYEEKRIPGLLKFKPTEQDTYRIIAVNEATTTDTSEPKGMVGSFTVAADDEPGSSTFDVGAGKLPHSKRIEYWHARARIVGKMLLVKHELLRTTNQVPIAAVTVDVIW